MRRLHEGLAQKSGWNLVPCMRLNVIAVVPNHVNAAPLDALSRLYHHFAKLVQNLGHVLTVSVPFWANMAEKTRPINNGPRVGGDPRR